MDINRRQFLRATSLTAGWMLSGNLRAAEAPAEEVNSITLANPVFLMDYPQNVSDYRCVVNKDGTGLIFERTIGTSTRLYFLDLQNTGAKPTLFAPSLTSSSRPDWSWQTGRVAFGDVSGVYLADSDGSNLTHLPSTKGMIYPTWYPDGDSLAVYNNIPFKTNPVPRTSKINSSGVVLQQLMANNKLWAGFPSVNQANPNLITFAGQLIQAGAKYDQNKNYIWLTDNSTNPPTVKTLEPAPLQFFDPHYQGRAPWYSPDGKWIAFESSRDDQRTGFYSIFIQPSDGSSRAFRVTDYHWNANHAKWFPNGTELVVSVVQKFGDTNRGIAKLDVSAFVR